jgi:hypothetical protein
MGRIAFFMKLHKTIDTTFIFSVIDLTGFKEYNFYTKEKTP